jgi:hypothetical protein
MNPSGPRALDVPRARLHHPFIKDMFQNLLCALRFDFAPLREIQFTQRREVKT